MSNLTNINNAQSVEGLLKHFHFEKPTKKYTLFPNRNSLQSRQEEICEKHHEATWVMIVVPQIKE